MLLVGRVETVSEVLTAEEVEGLESGSGRAKEAGLRETDVELVEEEVVGFESGGQTAEEVGLGETEEDFSDGGRAGWGELSIKVGTGGAAGFRM